VLHDLTDNEDLMPLTPPAVPRNRMHTRSIRIEAFLRDDGLWDLEAFISDIKDVDVNLLSGPRQAGVPVHSMGLRVTIDNQFNISAASATSDSSPYGAYCQAAEPAYLRLVGLNLMQGFRAKVKERLGGVEGCTHITELAALLPTAAIQSFVGVVFHPDKVANGIVRPFELDSCQALRSDSQAVATYYPKWHRTEPTL
jgi:hypothetical protein